MEKSPFDFGSLFTAWRTPAGSSASPVETASIEARVFSMFMSSSGIMSYRLKDFAVPHPPMVSRSLKDDCLYVSIPRQQHVNAGVQALDIIKLEGCTEKSSSKDGRVFINAISVVRCTPFTELLRQPPMGLIPLQMPESGKGKPFLFYSGGKDRTVSLEDAPGFHRLATWGENPIWVRSGVEEPRIEIVFSHRQWNTFEQVPTSPLVTLKSLIWADHCRQLPFTQDLSVWKAIIPVNPIPFVAACCFDADYSKKGILAMNVLSLQWNLRWYLEESGKCATLSFEEVKTFIAGGGGGSIVSGKEGDIINVSETKKVPIGPEWRFFAITSNPNGNSNTEKLKGVAVFLALYVTVVQKPKKGKKQKTNN